MGYYDPLSGKHPTGKGSDPRRSIDKKKFDDNWDRIFGKKKEQKDGDKK